VEPVTGWKNLYVCDRCGRIIQQDTLEVVGQRRSVQANA
jgi:DNA-directed RNA polymerase subunit RPC12/RpoP